MEDDPLMLGELRTRASELRSLRGDSNWRAFLQSVEDRLRDVQSKVFDLDITGADLERWRVRRTVLAEILSMQLVDSMIGDLDGRIRSIEEDDAKRNKEFTEGVKNDERLTNL